MTYPLKKIISEAPFWTRLPRLLGFYRFQPLYLLVHLTGRCDCACDFCYQRDTFFKGNRFDMPLDDFSGLMSQCADFFIKPRIHLIGGEPLLHDSLADVVQAINNYGFTFSLTTNASRLSEYSGILCSSGMSEINISIDAVGDDHDKLRRKPGIYGKAISGIKDIRQQPGGRGVWVNVSCLLGSYGQERAISLCNHLSSFGDGFINSFSLQIEHDSMFNKIDKSSFIKASLGKFRVFIPSDKKKGFCELPWLGMAVLPDMLIMPGGAVLSCQSIIGDLKNSSLKEIWCGRSMVAIRSRLLCNGLPGSCDKCCHLY
jgi:MoaA/NifB/PqqE/SkfB family radical SAM enzyme